MVVFSTRRYIKSVATMMMMMLIKEAKIRLALEHSAMTRPE